MKKYDVVAVVGSYQKGGAEKKVYRKVGAVFETDKGLWLKLDSLVTLDDKNQVINLFGLYEPKSDEKQADKPASDDFEDPSIPF